MGKKLLPALQVKNVRPLQARLAAECAAATSAGGWTPESHNEPSLLRQRVDDRRCAAMLAVTTTATNMALGMGVNEDQAGI